MSVELLNVDCMEYMKGLPDKAFDLAIVDPIYGVKEPGHRTNGTTTKLAKTRAYHKAAWKQEKTDGEYFKELFRVSQHQIIWGGNYFIEHLTSTRCFLVWDKNTTGGFADCELAWTSFPCSTRKFEFTWNGMLQGNMKRKQERIHPMEKPYQVYAWILNTWCEKGNKILDTHLGSGSSAIAAHKLGFDFVGCEIDKDYYDAAVKRYKKETAMPLFD